MVLIKHSPRWVKRLVARELIQIILTTAKITTVLQKLIIIHKRKTKALRMKVNQMGSKSNFWISSKEWLQPMPKLLMRNCNCFTSNRKKWLFKPIWSISKIKANNPLNYPIILQNSVIKLVTVVPHLYLQISSLWET